MTALGSFIDVVRGAPVDFATPPSFTRRYAALRDAEVKPAPGGGAVFHRARLFRRGGIAVLHLEGDRFEMAFQHGRLLAREIASGGSLHRASRIVSDAVRSSVGAGALGRLVNWYATACIGHPMLRRALARAEEREPAAGGAEAHLAEAYGLSEGSGVPVETIISAVLGPEIAQTLLGKTGTLAVGADSMSCTSFAAWGSATSGGEMIIGRNTDYPLNGHYDAHPAVLYFTPTDGALRYMAVTSAGFHNAGVCGMNERGIYLAVHTVPASRVSEHGLPLFMVGQAVLRKATCFDEARAMLQESRPAAGWNYHLVSVKERKAATIELSCDRVERHDCRGDFHVTTNHWRCAAMAERHLFVSSSVEDDTRARMERVQGMIEAAKGSLDAPSAAAILGDKTDPRTGAVRTMPGTVAASHTVSSSVWLPDQGAVFVASGRAPVSQTTYVELPAVSTFDPASFDAGTAHRTITNDRFRLEHPGKAEGEQIYIAARKALEYDDDAARAADLLEAALAADPENAAYRLMLGLAAYRAGRSDAAVRALESASAQDGDLQRKLVSTYVLGRVLAAGKRHAEARVRLQEVAQHPRADRKLACAARRSIERLERRGRLALGSHDIAPMTIAADVYRYDRV